MIFALQLSAYILLTCHAELASGSINPIPNPSPKEKGEFPSPSERG
jgi:hypothetical protein